MVSGETVRAEGGGGGCLFVMRVKLNPGTVNSEGLSASNRKPGYPSLTQKISVCCIYIRKG